MWHPFPMIRNAFRRVIPLLGAVLGVALATSLVGPVAARADSSNSITAFIQPLANCSLSFLGNLVCSGAAGPVVPISPDPAGNGPLSLGAGYRLCWTTAAGQTVPQGAACAAGTVPPTSATANFFATYPVTYSGSKYSGCGSVASPNGNEQLFYVRDGSACSFTVTSPDAPGFTSTATTFAFPLRVAPAPVVMGTLADTAPATGVVGKRLSLQRITCRYELTYLNNFKAGCPGVILNWTVLSGQRSCVLAQNTKADSETLDTVSVRFIRKGSCTVQGSYPEVPGLSAAYTTPVYAFAVKPRGRMPRSLP